MTTNLTFISEIIDSHIAGYAYDFNQGDITLNEYDAKTEALSKLKSTLKVFIAEVNNLTEDK